MGRSLRRRRYRQWSMGVPVCRLFGVCHLIPLDEAELCVMLPLLRLSVLVIVHAGTEMRDARAEPLGALWPIWVCARAMPSACVQPVNAAPKLWVQSVLWLTGAQWRFRFRSG